MKGIAALIATCLLLFVVALPQPSTTRALPAADSYEPDDRPEDAKEYSYDSPETRSIDPAGDEDWIRVTAEVASAYDFWTSSGDDLVMWLYDAGLNVVDYSDDYGDTGDPRIDGWCGEDALPAGIYYIRLEAYDDDYVIAPYELYGQLDACEGDLTPVAQDGYEFPVVPNSIKGTKTANTVLYANHDTYFDWFFQNIGDNDITASFSVEVRVDGRTIIDYPYNGYWQGGVGGFADWSEAGISPGWHTVAIEVDPEDNVNEFDESNNYWQKDFYWEPVEYWWGEYFNNVNLAGDPVFVSAADTVNFDWGSGSPGPGVNADNFSARWTRQLDLNAGKYLFTLTYDDAIRLYIDGQLRAQGGPAGTSAFPLDVAVGQHTLRVEMYDTGGSAVARLNRLACNSLTLNVSPSAGGTIAAQPAPNCGSWYVKDTVATLTAQPKAGYTFVNWSGAATGSQNPVNVTVGANKSVTANFTRLYTLDVTADGPGNVVVTPDKEYYNANESVSLTARADTGQRFTGWSGSLSGSANPATLTMNGNKSVTAHFGPIPCYSLTATADPVGGGVVNVLTPANCSGGKYVEGTVVSVQANANGVYHFSHWTGALSGSANPATLTMNGNKSVTAHFSQDCYSLAATADPVGGGGVNVLTPANCSGGKYTAGTQVNLSAQKTGDYFFTHWSGDAQGSNPNVWLTMDGNMQVVAHFSRPTCYSLTVDVTPALAGQVDVSPDPNCSGGRYLAGTQISLSAVAGAAYVFDHWSGAVDGAANPRALTINGDEMITAHFRAKAPTCYALLFDHSGDGGNPGAEPDRSPGCAAGRYVDGEVLALTANPAAGQRVARWEGTDSDASHSKTNTMTMPPRAHTVVVHYEESPVGAQLFIPLASHESCFTGQESEPNDKRDQANGPVCLGQPLFGRPDSGSDYFRLEVDGPWLLDVEMVNNAAQSPQLLLYDAAEPTPGKTLAQATRPPFRITYSLPPGVYYLRVAIAGGETNTIYTLLFH